MQDFRSKDGLYNLIPEQTPSPISSVASTPSKGRLSSVEFFPSTHQSSASTGSRRVSSFPISKLKGQDLFDASVWKNSHTTEVFYRFIASLRQKIRDEVKETSPTHKFIRTLRDGGRLMRCYTQNIDGLERREGLSMDLSDGKGNKRRFMKKFWEAPRPTQSQSNAADGGCEVVPLHGDLEVLRCTLCQKTCLWSDEATQEFLIGMAPECATCATKSDDRKEKGKRGVAVGLLRPNIVLYGEEHPSNQFLAPLIPFDLSSGPEVLIVMGTSLKVHGLQKVIREFAKKIHARKDGKGMVLFVNRTKPAESVWEKVFDSYVAMDCDDWVQDLRMRREDLFLRQGELNLNVTKPEGKKRKFTDDFSKPSKRPKIVVKIPSKQRTTPTTPWKIGGKKSAPILSLMTPPPSRDKTSVLPSDRAPTPEALTPPHTDLNPFERNMYENPFRALFNTHSRPKPARLRNTWKPSIAAESNGGISPERPELFSSIDERPEPVLLRNTWKSTVIAASNSDGCVSPIRPTFFSPIDERSIPPLRSDTWKQTVIAACYRDGGVSPSRPTLFSPIEERCTNRARPKPALLRTKSWKPSVLAAMKSNDGCGGVSPSRPTIFSPIEERQRRVRRSAFYEDPSPDVMVTEGEDLDEEHEDKDEDESASVQETPSKIRTKAKALRPSSDSSLNAITVREWSARRGEKRDSDSLMDLNADIDRSVQGRGLSLGGKRKSLSVA